jgi:hypothetical protein
VAIGSSSVLTSVCNAFPVWSRARRVRGRKSRANAPLIGLRRAAPFFAPAPDRLPPRGILIPSD